MKKKINLIILIMSIFMFTKTINAATCDNDYQCITCTYAVGTYDVTFEVKANGKGGATVKRTTKLTDEKSRVVYSFKDPSKNAITASNFIIESKKIVCPAKLYLKYETGASAKVGVYISFVKFSDSKANSALKDSTDNKKKFSTSKTKVGKSCSYSGTMIQGSGSVPVTITRNNNHLEYDVGNGYKVGTSEVSYQDFPKEKSGTCPTIYIKCGSNGSDKYCHIYKNPTVIDEAQSNPGQSGEDTPTGDDIKKQNNSSTKKSCKQIDGKYYDVDGKKVSQKEFEKSCNIDCGIFSGEFEKFLKSALALIRFAVPLIIIGLGIVDFIKATAAQDDSLIKKAANTLVKRMVIGVIIFVLPTLLEFILAIADIPYGTCGIK